MTDGMLWPAFTVVKAGSEMRRYYDALAGGTDA